MLDVGCFNGDFLSTVKDRYFCAGVEINSFAVERAIERGINIIGSNFSDLNGSFECITAFDVIEHIESPGLFVDNCLEHIVVGGYLIISTGNMESFSFKLLGPKYGYIIIPEHIAFVSPSWFKNLELQLKFRILESHIFSRKNSVFTIRVKELIINIVFKYFPRLFYFLRKLGFGNIKLENSDSLIMFPPSWGSAKDHFVIVLQKL